MTQQPAWLSYRQAVGADRRYLALARKWNVSEVARGRHGFLGVYARVGSASSMRREPFSPTQTWGERRQHFIARHLAQYKRKKTPRRALALRMWAFDTGDGALDAYL